MIGIRADGAPKPVGRYPHARRIGDLLFLSGVGLIITAGLALARG